MDSPLCPGRLQMGVRMSGVLEAAVAGPGRGVKQHWQSAEDPHGREGRGQMRQATDGQMEREDREPRGRAGAGWGVLPAREGVSGEEVRGGGTKERRSPRRGRHLVALSFRQEGSRERGVLGRLGRGAGGGMDAKGGPGLGALPAPRCRRPSETGHLIPAASVWNPR